MKVLRIFSLLLSCLCVVSIVGCVINLGSYNAKFDRVVELSEVLGADSKLSAQTSNGSINVTGTEMELCTITATINARSFTVEEAQLLAEQTDVRLEQTPEGLQTVIDRPKKKNRESISVQFEISVPRKTTLELRTSNGEIRVSSIEKAIDTQTSNGKIEITDVTGTVTAHTSNGRVTGTVTAHTSNGRVTVTQANAERFDLQTSNGAITCEAITGDMKASTSNGAIDVKYASDAAPATNIHLSTSNGGISVTTPKDYSAQVDASTSNSKIHTNIPITLKGQLGKKVKGTIGKGEGRLYLKTSNGSININ
ncbi:MAG: DUF4097 family beta strand repeat-containing protein [Planctomycetota bacterium]